MEKGVFLAEKAMISEINLDVAKTQKEKKKKRALTSYLELSFHESWICRDIENEIKADSKARPNLWFVLKCCQDRRCIVAAEIPSPYLNIELAAKGIHPSVKYMSVYIDPTPLNTSWPL